MHKPKKYLNWYRWRTFSFFVVASYFLALPAQANYQSDVLKSKKRNKPQTNVQWTLADWLTQKKQIGLMDQWLAAHQSSGRWFEIVASGAVEQIQFVSTGTPSTRVNGQIYKLDVFPWFLDLSGQYEKTSNDQTSYFAAGGLRLLGASTQTTNLIARYGARQLTDSSTNEKVQNPYAEGLVQLYIFKDFGLTGNYRYLFPATSNQANRWQGTKWTAGAFFEFGIVRIYAEYFQNPIQITAQSPSATVTTTEASGFEGGLKLLF